MRLRVEEATSSASGGRRQPGDFPAHQPSSCNSMHVGRDLAYKPLSCHRPSCLLFMSNHELRRSLLRRLVRAISSVRCYPLACAVLLCMLTTCWVASHRLEEIRTIVTTFGLHTLNATGATCQTVVIHLSSTGAVQLVCLPPILGSLFPHAEE